MSTALRHARAAMEWLGVALWDELRGINAYFSERRAMESACAMLDAQIRQAARLGLAGLINTSVSLPGQVAAEIARAGR